MRSRFSAAVTPIAALCVLLFSNSTVAAQRVSQGGIELWVIDSVSNDPIPEFRVIAGVRAGSAGANADVINWQPHTARLGKDGSFVVPLERAYDPLALRIEADGHQPQRKLGIRKSDGPQQLLIQLETDPGINARVLQPDGKPAAGATLALALPQRNAAIDNGRIRGADQPLPVGLGDRWRRPTILTTDIDGGVRVPTETDPACALLVVHESGVADMSFAEFQKTRQIKLRGWGRIEGRVLWHDKPGAEERVTLSLNRSQYGYPDMISSSAETRADTNGRFAFDRILPGRVQLSRPIRLPERGALGIQEVSFDGLNLSVEVGSERPTPVLLGGRGRKVVARLSGRASWEGVSVRFHPVARHFGMEGDNTMWKAFGMFRDSAIGTLFFRDGLKPDATGAVEIPHVLPGRYQLFVSAADANDHLATRVMEIAEESPDEAPATVDLGKIEVPPKSAPASQPSVGG